MNDSAPILLELSTGNQSMLYPVACLCLLLLPATILFALIRLSVNSGQDQYYHFALIESIRSNRHRFVRSNDFFLIKPEVVYPQLVHWFLSLLPESILHVMGRYLSVGLVFLSTLAFAIFAWLIQPEITADDGSDRWHFLLLCLALYVLTPFAYYTRNAKNAGLSARAVGLFLFELLLYCLVLYLMNDGLVFLVCSILLGVLVLLSSQFLSQCMLFVLPVGSILLGDARILFVPCCSLLLFMVLMPRFAIAYLRGQWNHKLYYFRCVAKEGILTARPGIWRDLVYDFWVRFVSEWKSRDAGNGIRGSLRSIYWPLQYLLGNPVVLVLLGLPLAVIVVTAMIAGAIGKTGVLSEGVAPGTIMGSLVIASLVVFILTSFRATRFLGEPERYVESVNVLAVVLCGSLLIESPGYSWILLPCLLLFTIGFLLMQVGDLLVQKYASNGHRGLHAMRVRLLEIASSSEEVPRVLANGMFQIRSLMSTQLRLVYGFAQFRLGDLPFHDVVDSGRMYRRGCMGRLARYYDVNYLLLQATDIPEFIGELEGQGLLLRQVDSFEDCHLFELLAERD